MARVYRAIELLAQIRLLAAHGIVTKNVDLDRVPEGLRAELAARRDSEDEIKVGLLSAWRILAAFPGDPLGRWFAEREGKLIDWVKRRNQSILAHGLRPIGETAWQPDGRAGIDLCREALDRLAQAKQRKKHLHHRQFPRRELLTGLT
jgi:CRISPR-associated protein (TIGR02710 family)